MGFLFFLLALNLSVLAVILNRRIARRKSRSAGAWTWLGVIFGLYATLWLLALETKSPIKRCGCCERNIPETAWQCPGCHATQIA